MQVDEATAPSAARGGETFYFCGEHCRREFLDLAPPSPPAAGGAPSFLPAVEGGGRGGTPPISSGRGGNGWRLPAVP